MEHKSIDLIRQKILAAENCNAEWNKEDVWNRIKKTDRHSSGRHSSCPLADTSRSGPPREG